MIKKILIIASVAIILGIISISIYSVYSYFGGNLEKGVVKALRDYAGLKVEIADIKAGVHEEIKVRGFKLYDKKNGKVLISAESAVIKYNLFRLMFGDRRISEIVINNGYADFIITKEHKINIISAISDSEKGGYSTPFVSKITIQNSVFGYSDYTNKLPIVKEAHNVNGFLIFDDKTRSLLISAEGNNSNEIFGYRADISLENGSFEMELNFKNIHADNAVLQYGYKNGDINIIGGNADINLKLNNTGKVAGKIRIKESSLKSDMIGSSIKNISGTIDIDEKRVKIDVKGETEDTKLKGGLIVSDYIDSKKTVISGTLKSDELNLNLLRKIKPLQDIKIPVTGVVSGIDIKATVNASKEITLEAKGKSKELKIVNEGKEITLSELNIDGKYEISLDENFKPMKNRPGVLTLKNAVGKYKEVKISVAGSIIDEKRHSIKAVIENINLDEYIAKSAAQLGIAITTNGSANFEVNNGVLKGKYKFNIKNSLTDLKDIYGEVEADLSKEHGVVKVREERFLGVFDINLKEKSVEASVNISSNIRLNYENIIFGVQGDSRAIIDLTNGSITESSGRIKAENIVLKDLPGKNGNIDFADAEYTMNREKVTVNVIEAKKGKSYISGKGEIELNENMTFNFSYDKSNINLEDFEIPETEKKKIEMSYYGNIALSGRVFGDKEKQFVEGTLDVEKAGAVVGENDNKTQINIGRLKSTYSISISEGMPIIGMRTSIKEIDVNGNRINDITSRAEYKKGNIYISEFRNNILAVFGEYKSNGDIDFDAILRDVDISKYKIIAEYKVSGVIKELRAKIGGNINNPNVAFQLNQAILKHEKSSNINFSGAGDFSNNVLKLNNFKVEQNLVNGTIDVEKRKIDLKLNILEPAFKKYYSHEMLENINGRVTGEIDVWGDMDDPKANGLLNLDSIYYNEFVIPKVLLKFSYNKKIINIMRLGSVNIEGKGSVDLAKNRIEFLVDQKGYDINKLQFLYPDSKFSGEADLYMSVNGEFDNPEFKLRASAKTLNIETPALGVIEIENLDSEAYGNKDEVNISKFIVNYNKEPVKISGKSKLDFSDYDFSIEAQRFNLGVVSILTKDKLKYINGNAKIKLNFKKDNFDGQINIEKMGIANIDSSVVLSDVYGTVNLNKDKVTLSDFLGKANNGTFNLNGGFRLSANNIADTDIKLNFYNFEYGFGKSILAKLEGGVNLKNKDITGKVFINEGEIRGIPEMPEASNNNQINPLEEYKIKIDIETRKNLVLSIYKFSILDYLEAYISGSGRFTMENNKANFIGTLSSERGVVSFLNNDFRIEKVMISFDDPYQYLPNLNPSVLLTAKTTFGQSAIDSGSDIDTEDTVYTRIEGYLQRLGEPEFYRSKRFSEDNKLSKDQVLQKITFKSEIKDGNIQDDAWRDFLQERLNKEFTKLISDRIGKSIGIQNFSISTKMFSLESDAETIKDPRLGAVIKGEKPIYKDIVGGSFLIKMSETDANQLDEYNLSLDYKLNQNISFALGTGKSGGADSGITTDTTDNSTQGITDLLNLFNLGLKFQGEF